MELLDKNTGEERMIKEYKINKSNSTVCGYPGLMMA